MSENRLKKVHSYPKKNLQKRKKRTVHSKKKKQMRRSIQKKKRRRAKLKKNLVELGASLMIVVLVIYVLSIFTCSFVKVEGYSMVPTVTNGEWVFVNKLAKRRRFKLIIYRDPVSKETSVRRLIGLPGEKIYYKQDKLYVNDHEVYERFIDTEVQRAKKSKSLYTDDWKPSQRVIPKNKYFIMGDNRPYAADSREYGYIDEKHLIGVVEMRVLPIQNLKQF